MPGYGTFIKRDEPEDLGPSLSELLVDTFQRDAVEKEGRAQGLYQWSLKVPEPKTGTLDFERYPFQRELYTDLDDVYDVCIQKATQVGVSAYLVRYVMHAADVGSKTALYVFPKEKGMLAFSDTRVRPIIMRSEYLRSRVPATHVQNKGLKQINLGVVQFRGSESRDGLESVDADRLALDEYDLLVQAHIPIAEQRLSNSPDPQVRRVGWPSIDGTGMHEQYLDSDQRSWHVKCERCKEGWQPIDFYENVDMERAIVVCKSCRKPLDVRKGQWVAAYPDRDKRGYHLPRQIVPHQDLSLMIKESRKTRPFQRENFARRWLGLPFAAEENRLTREALAAAQRDYTMQVDYRGGELVTMGIDVASARALTVRISLHDGDNKGALWIGEVDSFNDLPPLMERYAVNMACIDHMPEHRLARAFAERFPGRVYLVRYAGPSALKVLDVDDEMMTITVRRTEALDATFDMIRQQRNHLPKDRPEHYDEQMRAPVRFVETDDMDKRKVGYRKPESAADDFAHAEAYDLIAREAWEIRVAVDEAMTEHTAVLDDMISFERTRLNDDSLIYHGGYSGGTRDDEGEYSGGFGGAE